MIHLVVGLGNPGSQYDKTRHNAGFWFVDELARRHQGVFSKEKRFSGEACKVQIAHQTLWLLKPSTFMNRSGLPVRQLSSFFRIPVEAILVAHDELDIPAGQVRLKQSGGHGGHNGLRDLHAHMGKDYWRLRIGIDHPGDRNAVVNYVLSAPSQADFVSITHAIDQAADQMDTIMQGQVQVAMNELHRRDKDRG